MSDLDNFLDALVSNEQIYYAMVFRGDNIVGVKKKPSLRDTDIEDQLLNFATEIISKARQSLNKIPGIEGDIDYVNIKLQNNYAILMIRHGDIGLIIIAKMEEETINFDLVKELVNQIINEVLSVSSEQQAET